MENHIDKKEEGNKYEEVEELNFKISTKKNGSL